MKIAVIGGGSWATALVKILTENNDYVGWWMRDEESVTHIKRFHHNPRYLSSVELMTEKIDVSTDISSPLAHIISLFINTVSLSIITIRLSAF